jgi:hypothetical protein
MPLRRLEDLGSLELSKPDTTILRTQIELGLAIV